MSPREVDVDVQSCVLSLVELYTHWLSGPLHTMIVLNLVRSVLLLSDLFVVLNHFEWMLTTLLGLYDRHPHEDTSVVSLLVTGILKAAAVLRSVS